MQALSSDGQRLIADLAQRYGFSTEAVLILLQALLNSHGSMAQFNHPELGGGGQWMPGGMVMIGDMFNQALKARVDGLCSELAAVLAAQPAVFAPDGGAPPQGTAPVSLFVASGGGSANWWPPELGHPAATGSQNEVRYACFPAARRLAIQMHGKTTVYDTLDHQIGGFSQQQGGCASITFSSQYGVVSISDLPEVRMTSGSDSSPSAPHSEPQPVYAPPPSPPVPAPPPVSTAPTVAAEDLFTKIERLAELCDRGILTKEEFQSKKAELLSRL
jgi:hypothetical protein